MQVGCHKIEGSDRIGIHLGRETIDILDLYTLSTLDGNLTIIGNPMLSPLLMNHVNWGCDCALGEHGLGRGQCDSMEYGRCEIDGFEDCRRGFGASRARNLYFDRRNGVN